MTMSVAVCIIRNLDLESCLQVLNFATSPVLGYGAELTKFKILPGNL